MRILVDYRDACENLALNGYPNVPQPHQHRDRSRMMNSEKINKFYQYVDEVYRFTELRIYAYNAVDCIGAAKFIFKYPLHPWSPKFMKYHSTQTMNAVERGRLATAARDLRLWHPHLMKEQWFKDFMKDSRSPWDREYGPDLGPYRWEL